MSTPLTWSEDQLETLRRALDAGCSASQAARAVNTIHGTRYSRNAVIGVVLRSRRRGHEGGPVLEFRNPPPARSVIDAPKRPRRPRLREKLPEGEGEHRRKIGARKGGRSTKSERQIALMFGPSAIALPESMRPELSAAAAHYGRRIIDKVGAVEADFEPVLVDIFSHKESMCRWPYGDAGDLASFRYCGCQKMFRSSYCEHHHRRAWVTAAPPSRAPRH